MSANQVSFRPVLESFQCKRGANPQSGKEDPREDAIYVASARAEHEHPHAEARRAGTTAAASKSYAETVLAE